jgi:Icc-related predicted phosphoesterase
LGDKAAVRIFFATDIHGSDRCFRKFLAAASVYKADVLLLGGDVVGKAIVPIIRRSSDLFTYRLFGVDREVDAGGLVGVQADINFNGFYPAVLDPVEADRLRIDSEFGPGLFVSVIRQQMEEWHRLVVERLDSRVRCIVTPGNDDPRIVDEVFGHSERIEFPEATTIEVGPIWLASLGNTNRTPWDTEREFDEADLSDQIRTMVEPYADGRPLLFNFHCPPYGTGIDTVAQLDQELRPVIRRGAPVQIPAGSTAVKEAILQYQPVAGLHGHIHESPGVVRVGRTQCFNPGSDYSSGVLKGLIADFDDRGRLSEFLFTAG